MSVFYDNHGRDRNYGTHSADDPTRARWSPFDRRRQPSRRRPEWVDAPLLGLSYERAEGVIQLILAFALVGGAAAALNSSLRGVPAAPAPVPVVASSTSVPLPPPVAAPASQSLPTEVAPAAPLPPAPAQAAPLQASSTPTAPASAGYVPAPFFDSRPIAERTSIEPDQALQPLAPPSPEVREKLVVQSAAPPAPASSELAAGEETNAAESGRLTKCYLKRAGKPYESSECRIRQSREEVVFQFADKTLTFAHERGRAWIATLGGRKIGRVYQNARKPCWAARGFYACDNT